MNLVTFDASSPYVTKRNVSVLQPPVLGNESETTPSKKSNWTVNSICSFWQWNSIWGGGTTPPEISETTGRVNMKVLADVKLSEEARNQKKNWHNSTGL